MTTYYIDPSRSTNGDGSLATPYNVLPTITSNNTYLFRRNTTYPDAITVPSGVTKVIIDAYDTGNKPLIIPGTLNRWSIRVTQTSSYVTIKNLELTGALGNGSQTVFGIYIGSGPGVTADNITISDCVIRDIIGTSGGDCDGIIAFGDNLVFTNNTIYNIADDGIWVEGLNARIQNNNIYNVGTDSSATGDCVQLNGKTGVTSCGAFVVTGNTLNHSANLEKQCFIVSGASLGNGGLFAFNTCSFPLDRQNSGNYCVYSDQPGTKILRNYLYGGTGGVLIDAGANQVIRGNFMIKGQYGVVFANSPTGTLIEHNTITECLDNAMYLSSNDATTVVRYNVMYNNGKGLASWAAASRSKNSYYRNVSYDWATLGGGGSIEVDAILVDPQFIEGFVPSTTSPLYHTGSSTYIGMSQNGTPFYNPASIGAIESPYVRGTR